MKRFESHFATGTTQTLDLRFTSAVSGALVGGTMGILGGVVGIGLAGVVGAVVGMFGGLALERQVRRLDGEEEDGGDALRAAAALIEPPRDDDDALHTRQHPAAHLHYEYPQSFGMGSMLFRPTF